MRIAGLELKDDIDSEELRSLRRHIEGRGISFEDFITKAIEDILWQYSNMGLDTLSEDELREANARRKAQGEKETEELPTTTEELYS